MIKLRFVKLPHEATQLRAHQVRSLLLNINIPCESDEDPALAWVIAMHNENNIPYVPGLIDMQIVQEIESNPDVLHFIDLIGVDIFDDEDKESEESNE